MYVEGRIQTRQCEKDGQTRYITELLAERAVPLEPRARSEGADEFPDDAAPGARPPRAAAAAPRPAEGAGLGDDDLDEPPLLAPTTRTRHDAHRTRQEAR